MAVWVPKKQPLATLFIPGRAGGPVTELDEDSVDRTANKMGGWRRVKQPGTKGQAALAEAAAQIIQRRVMKYRVVPEWRVMKYRVVPEWRVIKYRVVPEWRCGEPQAGRVRREQGEGSSG
jgi:hypothetical protein